MAHRSFILLYLLLNTDKREGGFDVETKKKKNKKMCKTYVLHYCVFVINLCVFHSFLLYIELHFFE